MTFNPVTEKEEEKTHTQCSINNNLFDECISKFGQVWVARDISVIWIKMYHRSRLANTAFLHNFS